MRHCILVCSSLAFGSTDVTVSRQSCLQSFRVAFGSSTICQQSSTRVEYASFVSPHNSVTDPSSQRLSGNYRGVNDSEKTSEKSEVEGSDERSRMSASTKIASRARLQCAPSRRRASRFGSRRIGITAIARRKEACGTSQVSLRSRKARLPRVYSQTNSLGYSRPFSRHSKSRDERALSMRASAFAAVAPTTYTNTDTQFLAFANMKYFWNVSQERSQIRSGSNTTSERDS